MKMFTALTEKKLKRFSKKPEKKYKSLIFHSGFVTIQMLPDAVSRKIDLSCETEVVQ